MSYRNLDVTDGSRETWEFVGATKGRVFYLTNDENPTGY